MASGYEMQLLPDTAQVNVLSAALKQYSETTDSLEDQEIADELRLEILKKRREHAKRGN